MIIRRPTCYNRFQCTASKCSDNCCIGWEIDIDKQTEEVYQSLEGAFGERLRASVVTGEKDTHFILERERCPFLNKENLCDIIITLGEDKICDICREHPRFYEWFGDLTEVGLGLCCEEAARLVFADSEPMVFEVADRDCAGNDSLEAQPKLTEREEACLEVLLTARAYIFSVLQSRTESIWKRLAHVLDLAEQMQECLDFDDLDGITELTDANIEPTWEEPKLQAAKDKSLTERYLEILTYYRGLEPMDDRWPETIDGLCRNLDKLLKAEPAFWEAVKDREYEYEHLAVYLLYRYFLKAVFDGELLSRVKTVILNLLMVRLLDIACWSRTGDFSKENRIQTVKAYSKEIEYCVENLEELVNASWDKEMFSTEALTGLLQPNGSEK